MGNGVKEQLEILCNIYALNLLHKHLGEFLVTGSITSKQGALVSEQLRSLYSKVLIISLIFSKDLGGYQISGCINMRPASHCMLNYALVLLAGINYIEPSLVGLKLVLHKIQIHFSSN